MTIAQDQQQRLWNLESKLNNIANIVAALEVVSWQLAQSAVPDDVKQFRDAVIGISHALNAETENALSTAS